MTNNGIEALSNPLSGFSTVRNVATFEQCIEPRNFLFQDLLIVFLGGLTKSMYLASQHPLHRNSSSCITLVFQRAKRVKENTEKIVKKSSERFVGGFKIGSIQK